jgi:hypothetical protein
MSLKVGPVAGSCEYGNEPQASMKDQWIDCNFLKNTLPHAFSYLILVV